MSAPVCLSIYLPVVGGNAVLPSPLHVDGGQVHAEALPRLGEQVVRDLLQT